MDEFPCDICFEDCEPGGLLLTPKFCYKSINVCSSCADKRIICPICRKSNNTIWMSGYTELVWNKCNYKPNLCKGHLWKHVPVDDCQWTAAGIKKNGMNPSFILNNKYYEDYYYYEDAEDDEINNPNDNQISGGQGGYIRNLINLLYLSNSNQIPVRNLKDLIYLPNAKD